MWNFFGRKNADSKPKSNARKKNAFKPRMESLEPRLNCAGSLSVEFTDGILYVRGDAEDNGVRISRYGNEVIVIPFVHHGATYINNSVNSRSFTGVKGVGIYTYGGNDRVIFGSDYTSQTITLRGPLVIRTGSGNDNVLVQHTRVRPPAQAKRAKAILETGGQQDTLRVNDLIVGGLLIVDTNAGNDDVVMNNFKTRQFQADFGSGNDVVEFKNFEVTAARKPMDVVMGSGNDYLKMGERKVKLAPTVFDVSGEDDTFAYDIHPTEGVSQVTTEGFEKIVSL